MSRYPPKISDDEQLLPAIRQFIELQKTLLHVALSDVPVEASELYLNHFIPSEIYIGQVVWKVRCHGIGVEFSTSLQTVDVHCGVLMHPDAFDSYRLSVYWRSAKRGGPSPEEVTIGIQRLVDSGKVVSVDSNETLFELYCTDV